MINDKITWLNNWLKTDAEDDILLPSDQVCDIVLRWMHKLSDATATLIDIEHEMHIWGMSTTETALTVHLIMQDNTKQDSVIKQATKELHDNFGIEHTTIQIETGTFACGLALDEIV